jgi:PAS domain S-box-containing protein
VSGWPVPGSLDLGFLEAWSDPVLVADAAGLVVFVNHAAEQSVGNRCGQLAGRSLSEALFDEADRDAFREVSEGVLQGTPWRGQLEVLGGDGRPHHAEVSCSPMRRDDQVVGMVCVVAEVGATRSRVHTARHLADRLGGLAKVTSQLAVAEDLETVTEVITREAAQAIGATVGSLSLLADPDTLVLAGLHGGREGAAARWSRFSVSDHNPASDVVRSGQPLVLIGRDAIQERYPRLERAAEGERSMVVLPLRMAGRTIGVMSWSFPGKRRLDVAEMEFYTVLADTCAQAVERIRAQRESEQQAARVRFLADSTSKMAESLDYQSTLAQVARTVVPTFADWCAIDLVDDGRLHRLAVEHVDPEKVAMAVALERRYPARGEEGGAWTVIRTGEPLLVAEVTDEMVEATARDEEHRRLILQLQLRSVLVVPLIARGTVLGVMSWVMAESDRRYQEADVPFATDLARRAAIAIDNSRLHTETLEAAVRLQRAVLPRLPEAVPGWEVASHYSPSGRTEVGGDFFDVVPLGDDRLAMFVGDVMGRGVRAAAAMAQMRAAVRAYIADDPDPDVVLGKLDRLFAFYDLEQLVTMVYMLADGEQVRMMNAGHLPPVVLRADGRAESVPSMPGRPLGTEPAPRTASSFEVAEGEVLVAFTDGLVERRDEGIDSSERRLFDALTRLPDAPLGEQLEKLISQVRDHTRDDDVAALALRRRTLA